MWIWNSSDIGTKPVPVQRLRFLLRLLGFVGESYEQRIGEREYEEVMAKENTKKICKLNAKVGFDPVSAKQILRVLTLMSCWTGGACKEFSFETELSDFCMCSLVMMMVAVAWLVASCSMWRSSSSKDSAHRDEAMNKMTWALGHITCFGVIACLVMQLSMADVFSAVDGGSTCISVPVCVVMAAQVFKHGGAHGSQWWNFLKTSMILGFVQGEAVSRGQNSECFSTTETMCFAYDGMQNVQSNELQIFREFQIPWWWIVLSVAAVCSGVFSMS